MSYPVLTEEQTEFVKTLATNIIKLGHALASTPVAAQLDAVGEVLYKVMAGAADWFTFADEDLDDDVFEAISKQLASELDLSDPVYERLR